MQHYDTSFLKREADGAVVLSNTLDTDEEVVGPEPHHPAEVRSTQVITGSGYSGSYQAGPSSSDGIWISSITPPASGTWTIEYHVVLDPANLAGIDLDTQIEVMYQGYVHVAESEFGPYDSAISLLLLLPGHTYEENEDQFVWSGSSTGTALDFTGEAVVDSANLTGDPNVVGLSFQSYRGYLIPAGAVVISDRAPTLL